MKKKYFYITHPESLGGGRTLISSENEQFPEDEENRHYREYLEWVAEENEPEPWTEE